MLMKFLPAPNIKKILNYTWTMCLKPFTGSPDKLVVWGEQKKFTTIFKYERKVFWGTQFNL